jgi:hypothetical protein
MAASVLLTLAAAELLARLLGWGGVVVFEPNDHWGFLMKPSQVVYTYGHPVRINSLGLRGAELCEPKPASTLRIVFVGDSVTYGGGRIPEERLFCRQFETRARREGIDAEVVNLAAPAWSPQNWWGYIEKHGLYDADIVVLVLPECDLARLFGTMDLGGHWDHAPPLRMQSLASKALSRFYHERLFARHRREEVIAANLNAMQHLVEGRENIAFLAVLIPSRVPSQPDEHLWSEFLSHLDDPLDLRQDLQDPSFFLDGSHLNAKGHAYVGEKIFEKLQSSRHGGIAQALSRR